ncbi:DUF1592 domain-containing protein [Lignipirellula cremea]|uniref:Planctomycete cytochrome C n=1 Tax=Lignipirellula cremea TaxID=2528010 RepID=A0A518DLF9_9BACT|nr:DUF1592 domain-containing protein [Lignipirellula cremea]QDU92662.1 Planctomycete cytochrome C [Lignipirellula cremea]
MIRTTPLAAVLAWLCLVAAAWAEAPLAIDPAVQTFLRSYCVKCHGPEKQEADFRVDSMLKMSATPADAEYWRLVLDNLNLGEMPPEKQKQPTADEREAVIAWIEAELRRASDVLQGSAGEVVLRRLNRLEYGYTTEDLFGVRGDYTDGFPADGVAEGFDNNGAALVLSSAQLSRYLEASDFILQRAIMTGPRPTTEKVQFSLREIQSLENEKQARAELRKKQSGEKPTATERKRQEEAKRQGNFGSPYFPLHGDDALIVVRYTKPSTRDFFRVREPGWYRFQATAYAVRNQGEPVRLQITHGRGVPTEVPTVIDVVQLTDSTPQTVEYRVYLQPNYRVQMEMLDGINWLPGSRIAESDGPAIAIGAIEMEGPLLEQWPPAGHRNLLGVRDANALKDDEMPAILADLAPRLFRRPVAESVVQEFVDFYQAARAESLSPLDAFRFTAKAMLASPHFLYHVEPHTSAEGAIDEYALANRLSYFLWRSLPDAPLVELAAAGQLSQPDVLRKQVDRMLEDPKSERFLKDFVGQWLKISNLGEMQPDANLYPEYDADLERAMVEETESFVREMLLHDLPLRNLIDSDWAMLNDRLAQHYGIPGVEGNRFRRVALDKSATVRGGLLAQASILNITSNGTTTSPVVRGVWVLERLLGSPASPPPPDVPAIEPDIRGATTIQEQLEKHRSIEQCAACHRKIDPYGMALENFDVIGGWRDNYRALKPTANPNRPQRIEGQAVISADSLPQQGDFADFREFRALLLQREDLLERNVARQLAKFALGRSLGFADEGPLASLVATVDASDGGLKTMIRELVASELFRRP